MGSFTFANLFGSLMFSGIGFGALAYSRKTLNWKHMVIGIALMAYPYFIDSTGLMYVIGIALCTSLYFFRE